MNLLDMGLRPLDIMTRKAFENAITVVIALGGSTNAVLHLLAMASAAGVKLGIDDFTKIGKKVPVLADLKPSGRFVMAELVAIGGLVPLMKILLDAGLSGEVIFLNELSSRLPRKILPSEESEGDLGEVAFRRVSWRAKWGQPDSL